MTQVLGKITAPEREGPSGPDVMHRIEVPEAWFEEGVHLEIELPQRLACARCEGGGCDACGRSGAITLYAQGEVPLVVHVGLPRAAPGGVVLLRIPEGGAPYRLAGVPPAAAPSEHRGPEAAVPEAAVARAPSAEAPRLASFDPSANVAGLLVGKSEVPDGDEPRREVEPSDEGAQAEGAPSGGAAVENAGEAPSEAVGAPAADGGASVPREFGHRGMLYLRVTAAGAPSPGVARAYGVQSAAALSEEERRRLMQRSALLVGGLLAAFLVLLWLSGWL